MWLVKGVGTVSEEVEDFGTMTILCRQQWRCNRGSEDDQHRSIPTIGTWIPWGMEKGKEGGAAGGHGWRFRG